MKHGAKNRSNTRKILNNNNVHIHTHSHTHAHTHPPTHTHTRARAHARTHARTHTLFFWLTNNLKHSINYNKTKFLKQQNTKIEILSRLILKPITIQRQLMIICTIDLYKPFQSSVKYQATYLLTPNQH